MTRRFYGRSPAEQYMSSRPVAQTRVVHPRGARVNSRRCAALEGKRHELSGASSGPFAQSMAPRSRSAKRDTNAESTTPRAVCAPVSSRRSCVAVVSVNSLLSGPGGARSRLYRLPMLVEIADHLDDSGDTPKHASSARSGPVSGARKVSRCWLSLSPPRHEAGRRLSQADTENSGGLVAARL